MIHFDASAVLRLAKLLNEAGVIVEAAAVAELPRTAEEVAAQARATAAGYPKGTGALAADVNVENRGTESLVFTGQREGYFLEVGSPNTGAPRPWLSGPAGLSGDKLGAKLMAAGVRW